MTDGFAVENEANPHGRAERDALSRADLEAYGRIWGKGRERRACCPFCGDEHKRDREHACLAFNGDTGAWTCHRCGRSGLLREHWTEHGDGDPLRPEGRCDKKPRARSAQPSSAPPPSAAELAEEAERRATLRRLWTPSVPIDDPTAAAGAAYLAGRGIPLPVAVAAKVHYCADWYGRPAVTFPMQNEAGRLVAAESRYIDGGTPKSRSAGHKSNGVFVALPGALQADGVTICEGPITALSIAAAGYTALALCGQRAPTWLARRLALRHVLIALDEGEQKTEAAAQTLADALACFGAKVYRLRLPAEHGDWNDYLVANGRAAVDRELYAAMMAALGGPALLPRRELLRRMPEPRTATQMACARLVRPRKKLQAAANARESPGDGARG
jgi:phage/plasmid primase-like uncharacterized protein